MKKQNAGNYIKFAIAILLLLASLIAINVGIQQHQTAIEKTASKKVEKLSVAIVNEDIPLKVDEDTTYSLGASYIKSLEKNTEHDWTVTTRASAEAGLTSDKYQLMVIIPSNFSEKVLAVNSKQAEPATVTYKVNAQGNTQVEIKANKVGDQIISDLNQQLIDMYMVSVLENVYTAQQNVQALNGIQTTNINTYRGNLYQSTIAFPDYFPALTTLSNTSITGTDTLRTATQTTSKLFDAQLSAQQATDKSLQELIALRSADQITYADFISALMSMNQQVLSDETKGLYATVQATQATLTTDIVNVGVKDATTNEANGAIGELNTQIASLKKLLEEEQKANEERSKKLALELYQALYAYYYPAASQPDKVGAFTVAEFLSGSGLSQDKIATTSSDYQTEITKQDDIFKNQLVSLPSEAAYNAIYPLLADPSLLNTSEVTEVQRYAIGYYGAEVNSQTDTLLTELQAAKGMLDGVTANKNGTGTFTFTAPVAGTVEVRFTAPVAITLTGNSHVSGGQINSTTADSITIDVQAGDRVTIQYLYSYNPVITTNIGQSISATVDFPGRANDFVQSLPVDYSLYLSEDYRQKLEDYVAKSDEIIQRYKTAYQVMLATSVINGNGQRLPMTRYTSDFFNQDMLTLLTDIISTSSLNPTSKTTATLTEIQNQITQLEAKRDALQDKITAASTTNAQLTTDIGKVMDSLNSLQTQSTVLLQQKDVMDKSRTSIDSNYDAVINQVKSLISSTTDLKGNSEQNLTTIDTVKQSFVEFNTKAKTVEEQSKTMSADANALLTQLEDQLKQDNDFVAAFASVFNNAYKNGVPNEELIAFLTNPVISSEAGGAKATTNIYKPFTWILILGVSSLFAAYVFGTQTVLKKVQDAYKIDRLSETDWFNTALLAGLSIILGLAVGIFSANQLDVSQVAVPFWIAIIILFSILLVEGQYLLIKNMRVLGMGIALMVIISYIYLTSAVGTVVTDAGFLSVLKSINILSFLESSLITTLMKEPINGLKVGMVFLLAIGLIVANMFMPLITKRIKGVPSE